MWFDLGGDWKARTDRTGLHFGHGHTVFLLTHLVLTTFAQDQDCGPDRSGRGCRRLSVGSAYPDAVKVSEHDGAIIAVGAVVIRERHAHILFLFVDPEWQQRGIGHALLNELRRVIVETGCSVISLTASEDRRAWRRYLAMGLQPGAPIISMRAPVAIFPKMPKMPEMPEMTD